MKTVRVAHATHCPNGKGSDPFELEHYEDYDLEWFIDSLNMEELFLDESFCFLIDTKLQKDYTI